MASVFSKHDNTIRWSGLIQSAPLILADSDVTSKTIETPSLLGDFVSQGKMILTYETVTHFQTFGSERNASFSANCNVLSSLLSVKNLSCYIKQIVKAASFLCKIWSHGKVKDKWACISPVHPDKPLTLTETSESFRTLLDDALGSNTSQNSHIVEPGKANLSANRSDQRDFSNTDTSAYPNIILAE